MQKTCLCGEIMNVYLRTIVYRNQVEVADVPVFTCGSCARNELFPEVKDDLTALIDRLVPDGEEKKAEKVSFGEFNELALLISKASDPEHWNEPVQSLLEGRINELLDLLLLAQSLHDEEWAECLRSRLAQIAGYSRSAHFT